MGVSSPTCIASKTIHAYLCSLYAYSGFLVLSPWHYFFVKSDSHSSNPCIFQFQELLIHHGYSLVVSHQWLCLDTEGLGCNNIPTVRHRASLSRQLQRKKRIDVEVLSILNQCCSGSMQNWSSWQIYIRWVWQNSKWFIIKGILQNCEQKWSW